MHPPETIKCVAHQASSIASMVKHNDGANDHLEKQSISREPTTDASETMMPQGGVKDRDLRMIADGGTRRVTPEAAVAADNAPVSSVHMQQKSVQGEVSGRSHVEDSHITNRPGECPGDDNVDEAFAGPAQQPLAKPTAVDGSTTGTGHSRTVVDTKGGEEMPPEESDKNWEDDDMEAAAAVWEAEIRKAAARKAKAGAAETEGCLGLAELMAARAEKQAIIDGG